MTDTFGMSVRQAAELDHAFARWGWTPSKIKALCSGDLLGQLLDVYEGQAVITADNCVIDLDCDPYIPTTGARVAPEEEQLPNRLRGQFAWSTTEFLRVFKQALYGGDWVVGANAIPAHFVDFLVARPWLMPTELKGKHIFCWGTVYHDKDGKPFIRLLGWNGLRHEEECWLIEGGLEEHSYQPEP